jgi:hypothetical protein
MQQAEETQPNEATWSGPRGSVRVWQPMRGVVAYKVVGHLHIDGTKVVLAALERMMRRGTTYVAFNDYYEMEGYDSPSRIAMTDWTLASRSKFSAIHILVRSKIVSMGVSVANLALGGLLSTYTSPKTFNELIRATTKSQPSALA